MDTTSPDTSGTPADPSRGASGDINSFYTPWLRFLLLLTGSTTRALEILQETLDNSAGQLREFRSVESKVAWLLRTLQEKAKGEPLADGETHWARAAALPEGERVAFALYHAFPWGIDKLEALSGHRSRFAEWLAKARSTLAPELYFPVDPLLAVYRPWITPEAPRIEQRVKKALDGGEKTRLPLETQIAFDSEWHDALEAVRIPEGVTLPDVMAGGESAPTLGRLLRQPAVLAIGVAFLVMIGVVCFTALSKMEDFQGRETVDEIIAAIPSEKGPAEEVGGVEAGTLEDWFLLKGFEGFTVPPELAKAKVDSCRVLRFSGEDIAQLNLSEKGAALLVFQAVPLNVDPEPGTWSIYQFEGSAVAIKREGAHCFLLTYTGDSREMNALLAKLSQ